MPEFLYRNTNNKTGIFETPVYRYLDSNFLFQQLIHNIFFLNSFCLGFVIAYKTMAED